MAAASGTIKLNLDGSHIRALALDMACRVATPGDPAGRVLSFASKFEEFLTSGRADIGGGQARVNIDVPGLRVLLEGEKVTSALADGVRALIEAEASK